MNFSKLAMLRNDMDLSQRQLALILKVSKSTYARWETQEEIIPLKHLANYCQYFKVSMDYILGLSKENNYKKYNYTKKIDRVVIGKNIKDLRKKYKLTQRDFATFLNTSQSTICAYESGKTLVLTAFLYSLAKEINVSVDKLCGLEKKRTNKKESVQEIKS